MIHHIDRYLKLKQQAKRFMLNGDVGQYMRALRLISQISVR